MGQNVKKLFMAASVAALTVTAGAAFSGAAHAGSSYEPPSDWCPDKGYPDKPDHPHKPPHYGGKTKFKIDINKIKITKNVTKHETTNNIHNETNNINVNVDRGGRRSSIVFVGGSTTFIDAPKPVVPLGNLSVMVPGTVEVERKPVKGVCQDAKGLEEAARMSVSNRVIEAGEYQGEVFHCLAGDMLTVTLGHFVNDGQAADYTDGYSFTCEAGDSLHMGADGRVACGPASELAYNQSPAPHGRFAEVILQRSSGGAQTVQAAGGDMYFSGGVGN
ncbi:hypothetical protein ACSHT0_00600 [Tepidicaulis sp. LMO-SS28]|uniref:hypothetical protein n=1 Tax=Tepidicaulis sp. LMO-SS28 TaxID=3447455 RepID=UPI003EE28419